MIDRNTKNRLICEEFSHDMMLEWFDFKDKQVLNYIDTVYYTVLCSQDCSSNSTYKPFRNLIESIDNYRGYEEVEFCPYGYDFGFYYSPIRNGIYDYHVFAPDAFDIFVCSGVPTPETPFIQVQIRSTFLWMEGVEDAINKSRNKLLDLFGTFGFVDDDFIFRENRFDYCFHTNYIRKPYLFFSPSHMARVQCSKFKSSQPNIRYSGASNYEINFYPFGQRSAPVYVRFYIKSLEVVEMGKKNKKCFFISVWKQKKLINAFDAYCLTRAYVTGNWNYIDIARLQYYVDYGLDEEYKKQAQLLIDAQVKDWDDIKALADKLTPPIHLVCNFEFQCLRKFFKSCELWEFDKDRLINVFRNTDIITQYLTEHTMKLVDYKPERDNPKNKYKCSVLPVWKLIQQAKFCDGIGVDYKLVRDYTSQTNIELLKNRAYSSISTLSLSINGDNTDDLVDDIETLIAITNDNDIANQRVKKELKKARISELDSSHKPKLRKVKLIDADTGELL